LLLERPWRDSHQRHSSTYLIYVFSPPLCMLPGHRLLARVANIPTMIAVEITTLPSAEVPRVSLCRVRRRPRDMVAAPRSFCPSPGRRCCAEALAAAAVVALVVARQHSTVPAGCRGKRRSAPGGSGCRKALWTARRACICAHPRCPLRPRWWSSARPGAPLTADARGSGAGVDQAGRDRSLEVSRRPRPVRTPTPGADHRRAQDPACRRAP
jgi:hypothetical protein